MTEFKGNLGNYKIIETEDGTKTVLSEYFNEACHNLSGAYEETLHNYILGCKISDLIAYKKEIAVLDVGFGIGMGLKALIDQFSPPSSTNSPKLFYYSIELDESLLLWSLSNTLPDIKLKRIERNELVSYEGVLNEVTIQIYIGDGRTTLPLASSLNLIKPLDAIFQDAFSPRKNPALWSVEWFLFLKNISNKKVQLSTYSSSASIRKSLLSASWIIEEAKGFAHKKSMTKAKLVGETSPHLLEQLTRSPSLEIRDK